MENDLSIVEIRFIQKLLSTKSVAQIAELIDKPVSVVAEKICDLTGINKQVSFDQKSQQKQAQKLLKKQKKSKRSNTIKKKKKQDADRQQMIDSHNHRKLLQQQELGRRKRDLPLFVTKQIDYSQMVTVRIDDKTTVYAKPGEDPNEVKSRYKKAAAAGNNSRFRSI